jgi:site-specific DNA-methyltransferase (adenine-specific)
MTMEHLDAVRRLIGEVPEWVERECEIRSVESENFKAREVVGQRTTGVGTGNGSTPIMGDGNRDITAPATAEAQQWQGWGTALKPALEPITMARKPLTGTVAANVLEHGTGALNVDGCRVWTDDGQDRSRPPRTPNAILGGGKGTNLTASEHNFLGRWPANLIHDGSDEVVGLFPQTTSGANPTRRGGMGYHGAEGQEQCHAPRGQDTGSAARFFYTAKASASERQGVAHPTVKPLDLMAYLCRLVTPPGGVVLDPFMGSGTTIKAAIGEGFQAIGIERDPAYFEMAQHRMDGAQLGLTLPAAAPPAPQSRTD